MLTYTLHRQTIYATTLHIRSKTILNIVMIALFTCVSRFISDVYIRILSCTRADSFSASRLYGIRPVVKFSSPTWYGEQCSRSERYTLPSPIASLISRKKWGSRARIEFWSINAIMPVCLADYRQNIVSFRAEARWRVCERDESSDTHLNENRTIASK